MWKIGSVVACHSLMSMYSLPDADKWFFDANGDGEVNIADVNALIDIILGGEDKSEGRSDVNEDNEVNIADINSVIDIIFNIIQ